MFRPSHLKDYFIPKEVLIDHCWVDVNGEKSQISILRLDTIHPIAGGNKAFKLYENVERFFEGSFDGIVSVGGQYSNHIAALAQVGKDFSIPTAGFIRGDDPETPTNTIRRAMANGMEIIYVSREKYREMRKHENPLIDHPIFKKFLFIPEGGGNELGEDGCKHIFNYIPSNYTHILLAVGTGTTLKGMASQLKSHQQIIGVKVLDARQEEYIFQHQKQEVSDKIRITSAFTFGGYAKRNDILDEFVGKWNENYSIAIEPIYTGRLFFAAHQLLQQNYFPEYAKIIVIHSGGLQYLHH